MTTCPSEQELIELIDAELAPDREAEVLDHVAICDDCAALLVRSEAALRYAIGGLADAAGTSSREEHPAAPVRTPRARKFDVAGFGAAAAVLVAAAGLAWVAARPDLAPTGPAGSGGVAAAVPDDAPDAKAAEPSLDSRIDALLVRAERCLTPLPDEDAEDLLAGLAAAERARDHIALLGRQR